jgi:hypothetical protein
VITYALTIRQPQIATEYARKTLENHPEDVYALTVMMTMAQQEGNLEKARQLAQTICRIETDENSPSYRKAKEVLASEREELK